MERKKSGKKFGKTSFDSVPPGPPPTHQTKNGVKGKRESIFPILFLTIKTESGDPAHDP
jgi:hypothetical protein